MGFSLIAPVLPETLIIRPSVTAPLIDHPSAAPMWLASQTTAQPVLRPARGPVTHSDKKNVRAITVSIRSLKKRVRNPTAGKTGGAGWHYAHDPYNQRSYRDCTFRPPIDHHLKWRWHRRTTKNSGAEKSGGLARANKGLEPRRKRVNGREVSHLCTVSMKNPHSCDFYAHRSVDILHIVSDGIIFAAMGSSTDVGGTPKRRRAARKIMGLCWTSGDQQEPEGADNGQEPSQM